MKIANSWAPVAIAASAPRAFGTGAERRMAGMTPHTPQNGLMFRHLRNPFRRNEGCHLDSRETGCSEIVDEADLVLGRDQALLVLESVPRTDFDEGNGRRGLNGRPHT